MKPKKKAKPRATSRHIRAAYLLANGAQTIDVLSELKISRATLSRIKTHPRFIDEYEALLAELRLGAPNRIYSIYDRCLRTLSSKVYGFGSDAKLALEVVKFIHSRKLITPDEQQQNTVTPPSVQEKAPSATPL